MGFFLLYYKNICIHFTVKLRRRFSRTTCLFFVTENPKPVEKKLNPMSTVRIVKTVFLYSSFLLLFTATGISRPTSNNNLQASFIGYLPCYPVTGILNTQTIPEPLKETLNEPYQVFFTIGTGPYLLTQGRTSYTAVTIGRMFPVEPSEIKSLIK